MNRTHRTIFGLGGTCAASGIGAAMALHWFITPDHIGAPIHETVTACAMIVVGAAIAAWAWMKAVNISRGLVQA